MNEIFFFMAGAVFTKVLDILVDRYQEHRQRAKLNMKIEHEGDYFKVIVINTGGQPINVNWLALRDKTGREFKQRPPRERTTVVEGGRLGGRVTQEILSSNPAKELSPNGGRLEYRFGLRYVQQEIQIEHF